MKVENRTTLPTRFVHRAGFYSSNTELLEVAMPIVREALSRDIPVAVISSADTERELRRMLGGSAGLIHLPAPEAALRASGQAVITRRARELRELTDWAGSIAVIAEHHPELPGIDQSAWIEAEAAMNVALAMLPITMTCLYPAGVDHAVNAVRWNHPHLVHTGGTTSVNEDARMPADVLARYPAPAPATLGLPHREMGFTPWQLIELRKAVAEAAEVVGIGDSHAQDFVLAVNEVASNAVEHGYGVGELRIWQRSDQLICEVHDKGMLGEPLPGLRPPHPNSPRGRGLWIARQLCDLLHVWTDQDGTHVRLQTGRC